MATSTRLGLTLLEVAGKSKEVVLNAWLTGTNGLDNAALVTIANTFTQRLNITQAPTASVQFGNLNVGDGGFAGGAGHYSGAAGGSLVAVNLVSGGTADLLNLQINGVSKWKLGSGGNVTYGEGSNQVFGTGTGTQIGTAASQKLVLWGGTPVVRPASNAELRQSLIDIGAITGGINSLNTNGGDLTANQGLFSGALQGSGTALTFKRLLFTWAADANQTLDATEKANCIIDIQTGVITAQRDLLVSGNAGAFYVIINRNAQPVNVRVGANAGIVVAATRSRIICFPGGTVAFSLTLNNDYSV
jgi:hypothetical protein